jgi:signal transduction histidine kinase
MDAVSEDPQASPTPAVGSRSRAAPVEAVAIAEEVVSSFRHDLRNKLSAIRNAVYYIERSLTKSQTIDHDPRVARFLELVREQLSAADDLLDQRSRSEALLKTVTEPIRLGACVQAALARRVVPEGVSVHTDLADQSEFFASSDELVLAIDCLLDNAFEAVGRSGAVTLRTDEDPALVRLLVEDTGPGMTEEQRARALVPFASDKPGHLGIGLNIAARIAGRLGGSVESSDPPPPRGTAWVFTVSKPA